MSAEEEIGTLIIVVLKARNLNDKHFYKQDVYTTINLSGVKKQTKIDAKGGQHPVWDEELRFPIMKNGSTKYRKLQAQCWSKEHRDDDMLGEGAIDISETLKTGEFDDWIPLQVDGVERGELYLEMTFYSNGPAPVQAPSVMPKNNNNLSAPVNPALLQRRPSKLSPSDRLSRLPQGPGPNSHSAFPNPHQRPVGPQKTPPRTPPKDSYSALPSVPEVHPSSVPSLLKPGPHQGRPQSSFQPAPATQLQPTAGSGQAQRVPSILRPANPKAAPESVPSSNQSIFSSGPASGSTIGYPQPNGQTSYGSVSQPEFPTHSHPATQMPAYQTYNSSYAPPPSGPNDTWPSNPHSHSQPQVNSMSLSFPVPEIVTAPMSPPPQSSTPYDQFRGSSANFEPRNFSSPSPAPNIPSHTSQFNIPPPGPPHTRSDGDLPDPYLLARYQTPLPLPPGAERRPSPVSPPPQQPYHNHARTPSLPELPPAPPKPPSPFQHKEPPTFPSASPPPPRVPPVRQPTPIDQERIRILRQAETEAARRRQQEEQDAELARQLDRDFSEQENAPPPPPRKSPSPVREDPAVAAKRLREQEEAHRREQEEKDLELARQLDRELNLAGNEVPATPPMPGGL
ncbi:hypothetical protein AAF712_007787 [Marasmius tenuissimus]|uniref:C2 domain-containing protein n=1 Tax=Marasmius tenuissimus TaxID=585030 RepID=A0ABR2ZVD6_9AGAR